MRIFVDIEATEAGEILALGAVADNNERFFSAVRPIFSRVTPRITVITGVTQDQADEFPTPANVIPHFIEWAIRQGGTYGVHFFTFGKNDRQFVEKTRAFWANEDKTLNIVAQLGWIAANMSNGAAPIYDAFRRPLISLRSAYLTYKETNIKPEHCSLEDAVMFKELIDAVENGWTLPDGARIVKITKPVLPPKDVNHGEQIPKDLDRKVVAYWVRRKDGSDQSAVYANCIVAAKALCTQAIQTGKLDPIQAGYRVLNAAVIGETYCDRKFFLVD